MRAADSRGSQRGATASAASSRPSSRASPEARRPALRKQATLRPVAAAESAQQALAAVLAEAEGWGVGGRAPILLLSHDGVAEEALLLRARARVRFRASG